MKAIFALVLGLVAFNTAQAGLPQLCAKQMKAAENAVAAAKDAFRVGEYTKTDLAAAQMNLLNVKRACGYITIDSYCTEALAATETLVQSVQSEASVGSRTNQDVLDAQNKRFELEALCY